MGNSTEVKKEPNEGQHILRIGNDPLTGI